MDLKEIPVRVARSEMHPDLLMIELLKESLFMLEVVTRKWYDENGMYEWRIRESFVTNDWNIRDWDEQYAIRTENAFDVASLYLEGIAQLCIRRANKRYTQLYGHVMAVQSLLQIGTADHFDPSDDGLHSNTDKIRSNMFGLTVEFFSLSYEAVLNGIQVVNLPKDPWRDLPGKQGEIFRFIGNSENPVRWDDLANDTSPNGIVSRGTLNKHIPILN